MKKRLLKKQIEWLNLLKTKIRPGTKASKFGQHQASLVDYKDKKFCCLGVCERFVMGKSFEEIKEESVLSSKTKEIMKFRSKEGKFLKPSKKELLLIQDYSYLLYHRILNQDNKSRDLADLNDHDISFNDIAWFVETFPHLVFK